MWYYILTFIVLLSPNSLRTEAYKAAVIEYFPVSSDTPQDTIRKNLNEYRTFADTARLKGADIIVFPEYGLTTAFSDPEEYAIDLSDGSNNILRELKTMANERQIYMVVNLLEKSSQNGLWKYFSTDLVFKRDGDIVAKYRKINLYKETKLTPGDRTQSQTFTTDFGVSFGILNSFDIFDNDASQKLFENVNVTDVIFLSSWVSLMPFFTSLSVQHGYAIANGVNLLAASYGGPKQGRGGSGIYLADGKIAESYIADSSSSKPIIQSVIKQRSRVDTSICSSISAFVLPGDSTKSNVSNYITKTLFDPSKYNFEPVDLRASTTATTVCNGNDNFCCFFNITVDTTQSSSDIYKVLAFDGEVTLDQTTQTTAHLRFCSLVACESNSDGTCGARVNTTARFKKITVEGNLPIDNTSFYTPLTLNTFLMPSPHIFFCNNNNGTDTSYVQLTTKKAYDNVLAFGLIGRTNLAVKPRHDDDNPGNPNDPEGSGSEISVVQNSFRFLLFLVLMKYVFL